MELKIKLGLFVSSLVFSSLVFADIPNTFEAGTAINASDMNENFTSIDNDINTISDDVSDLDSKTANYSDLEIDVSSLKAKVELLESLLVLDDVSSTAEFVGVSSSLTTGNVGGLNAMNQLCNVDYIDSRMCTTKDISSSGVFPEIPYPNYTESSSVSAWVHNNSNILNVTTATNSAYSNFTYEDWPNESHQGGRGNCLNWSMGSSSTGSVLSTYWGDSVPETRGSLDSCATTNFVACCK